MEKALMKTLLISAALRYDVEAYLNDDRPRNFL